MRFLMLVCRDATIALSPRRRGDPNRQEVAAWVSEMGAVLAYRCKGRARACGRHGNGSGPRRRGNRRPWSADGRRARDPASGFNILSCASMDEAVEVAAKHPISRFGTIELRPIAGM